ncbi:MAG TPA: S8 family peptidase [Longimicrobium sp.]|jgi:subtilisin family serine protease|uniref:S8 family peptidase n=1 Tax=Longimicrobium sp. TaxID=2029185 RepID=UPI002EDB614C
MKLSKTAVAVGALALAACSDQSPVAGRAPEAAPLMAASANGIEGSYVVVLKDGANPRSVAAVAGVEPGFVYTAAVNGFSATLNAGQLNALRHNPNVEYVEQDQVMSIDVTQSGATWGLDRIDQTSNTLNGTYIYNTTASNVTAYVIDTGVTPGHTQFGGRASSVYNAVGGSNDDCNGHGTHVAGTIGGSTYGVAKAVRIRGVKVLSCSGSGSTSGIIAGVDWVRLNATKPAVANLSLGGGFSSATNTAVNNLANSGVYVAVASGNSNANACNYSPASAANVTSVNASTSTNAKASFSNYGSCTHLYAPGQNITSAWYTSSTATNTISGTSMASPHVAGVGALYLAGNPTASNATVRSWIINNATPNVISGNPTGTPNRLLFKSTL